MILAAKFCLLAVVAIAVAVAEGALDAAYPVASQAAAVDQFDDTAWADQGLKTYAAARNCLADLLWLAVPAAAFALFAGDVTRPSAARR